MSSKARKKKAGKLLTKLINKIASEKTEFIKHPDKGDTMVTKAEAMARIMFKMALGFEETVEHAVMEGGKKIGVTETVTAHAPDKQMIGMIYDRMEGKAMPVSDSKNKRKQLTAADKVTDQSTSRINDAGK